MSLAFKQQNKLTVKIGLSAFVSLRSELSLTFFQDTHLQVWVIKRSNFFSENSSPQGPISQSHPIVCQCSRGSKTKSGTLGASSDPFTKEGHSHGLLASLL